MTDISIDKVVENTNAALADLYTFDRLLWMQMIRTLEAQGVIKEGTFADSLEKLAHVADEEPGQLAAMLRDLAAHLGPGAPPPRWTPKVIRGGKE